MSLNRILGNKENDPDATKELPRSLNRLIIAGNNSVFMNELIKIEPSRAEDSLFIKWAPNFDSNENLISKITSMTEVKTLDIVIANSCEPDMVRSERELRAIYSDLRSTMQEISDTSIASRAFRWWMCIEVDGLAPHVVDTWLSVGRLVFRHAAESAKFVGSLVLVGNPANSAIELRNLLDNSEVPESRVVDFARTTSSSISQVTHLSHRNVSLSPYDLPSEQNFLLAEIDLTRDALNDLGTELRDRKQDLIASQSELTLRKNEVEQTSLQISVQSHELFAVETDIVAQRGHVAIMADQSDALRREIEYLLAHHASLTENLAGERAALNAVREEVSIQLARAEQLQSALTRSEVDAAQQRMIAAEAIRQAEAATARLNESTSAITTTRQILAQVVNEVEDRKLEIKELDVRRAEKSAEAAEFEVNLTSRLLLLESEVAATQKIRHDATLSLENIQAERSAVLSELVNLAGSDSDPQIEALRISRDYLETELLHLEQSKTAIQSDTEEIQEKYEEMLEFIARIDSQKNALEASLELLVSKIEMLTVEHDQLEANIFELQEKKHDAEQLMKTLDESLVAHRSHREELKRLDRKLDERQAALDTLSANIENEVSERVITRLNQLFSMPSRSRKKAMQLALTEIDSTNKRLRNK
jgi:DNA repair exonuclease SbcCD ATPase subunit